MFALRSFLTCSILLIHPVFLIPEKKVPCCHATSSYVYFPTNPVPTKIIAVTAVNEEIQLLCFTDFLSVSPHTSQWV